MQFKNYRNKIPVPFVRYADFESFNTNIINNKDDIKTTEKVANHTACHYAYQLVCTIDDKFTEPLQLYRGDNVAYYFIWDITKEEKYCKDII